MPTVATIIVLVKSHENGSRVKHTIGVPPNCTVGQLKQIIWGSCGMTTLPPEKEKEYGLFKMDISGSTKGQWLKENFMVADYIFNKQDVLDLRKQVGMLKIMLLDNSIKTFHLDLSLPVQQLIPVVCSKIGITNYEEYDLSKVPQSEDVMSEDTRRSPADAGHLGFSTIERSLKARDARRMEKLKQKLATDDDVLWIDHEKTLVEQGIEEGDVVLLRRRYFYSDINVNVRDAVEVNLLFAQCRDAIVSGTHPVTVPEAIAFAGLQAQAEYGDFTDSKRSIDVKPMLPKNFTISKRMDKKLLEEYRGRIQVEWQGHKHLDEHEAKHQYIKSARSLKTYGVTFFLVKEKMRGKNKMVPRLFGVSKNAVLRLDENTKETLNLWPMRWIHRWAVTPNTLSLDFGDYGEGDGRYSIQTSESKTIADLIAGYIELIRKRQKLEDFEGKNAHDTSVIEEYEEEPIRQTLIAADGYSGKHAHQGATALPGILRHTTADEKRIYYAASAQAKVAQIVASFAAAMRLPWEPGSEELMSISGEGSMVKDSYEKKVAIGAGKVAAMVGKLINITADAGRKREEVDDVLLALVEELDELANSLRNMSHNLSDAAEQTNLLSSAQSFCQSFTDLLKAAEEQSNDTNDNHSRQAVLRAAATVADSGLQLRNVVRNLSNHSTEDYVDTPSDLFSSVQQIGTKTAEVVRSAKLLSSDLDDPALQAELIAVTTQIPFRSADVMVCAKLLRMCAYSGDGGGHSRQQLLDSLNSLQDALDFLASISHTSAIPADDHGLVNGMDSFRRILQSIKKCLNDLEERSHLKPKHLSQMAADFNVSSSSEETLQKGRSLALLAAALADKLESQMEKYSEGRRAWFVDVIRQLRDSATAMQIALEDFKEKPDDQTRRQAIYDHANSIKALVKTITAMDQKRKLLQKILLLSQKMLDTNAVLKNAAKQEMTTKESTPDTATENLHKITTTLAAKFVSLAALVEAAHLNDIFSNVEIKEIKEQLEWIIFAVEDVLDAGKAFLLSIEQSQNRTVVSSSVTEMDSALTELLDCLLGLDTLTIEETKAVSSESAMDNLFLFNHWQRNIDQEIMSIEGTAEDQALVGHHYNASSMINFPPIRDNCGKIAEFIRGHNSSSDGSRLNEDQMKEFLGLMKDFVEKASFSKSSPVTYESHEKISILNHAKTVLEAATQYISSMTEAENTEDREVLLESLSDFSQLLQSIHSGHQFLRETLPVIDTVITSISVASDQYSQQENSGNLLMETASEVTLDQLYDLLEDLLQMVKTVDFKILNDRMLLRDFGRNICGAFKGVCDAWILFSGDNPQLEAVFRTDVHLALVDVGKASTEMLLKATAVRISRSRDPFTKACRDTVDQITVLQSLLQTLDCGTRSCIRALSTIEEVEEDLETAIAYASLGGFSDDSSVRNSSSSGSSDGMEFVEELSRRAQELMDSIRRLGAASTQKDLSHTMDLSLNELLGLVDLVKKHTNSTTTQSSDAQIFLLRTVKEAATAVRYAVAGMGASGRFPAADTEQLMKQLSAVDFQLLSVTTYAQVLSSEGPYGIAALQIALRNIKILNQETADGTDSVDGSIAGAGRNRGFADVIVVTKQLRLVVEKAESALRSRKNEDLLVLANTCRSASRDLHTLCREFSDAGDTDTRENITRLSQACSVKLELFLTNVNEVAGATVTVPHAPSVKELEERKAEFLLAINQLEAAVHTDVLSSTPTPSLHGDSPDGMLEHALIAQELSGAAENIEKANQKLDEMLKRKSVYLFEDSSTDDESCVDYSDGEDSDSVGATSEKELTDFNQNILDFCRSVTNASAMLIPAAGAAQSELVRQGKVSVKANRYTADGQWSQGFISAAKAVGISCRTLCHAAQELLSGRATEEKLISASKQVASFTAQLLLACRVKGDPKSETMQRLMTAGMAVRKATDQLVYFLTKRKRGDEANIEVKPVDLVVNSRLVGGVAQEIKANEQVALKEKALTEAQRSLLQARKRKSLEKAVVVSKESAAMDELSAQENVLIKERELSEAKAYLGSLQQKKYGHLPAEDEFKGYGHLKSTLPRKH